MAARKKQKASGKKAAAKKAVKKTARKATAPARKAKAKAKTGKKAASSNAGSRQAQLSQALGEAVDAILEVARAIQAEAAGKERVAALGRALRVWGGGGSQPPQA